MGKMQEDKNLKKYRRYRVISQAVMIPINLVVCGLIGFSIGYGIDYYFKTDPVFKLIFLALGIIAGIREMMKTLKTVQKELDKMTDDD